MKTLLALLTVIISLNAHAGSFTRNGADRKGPGHGAAWFLGDAPVKWCATDPRTAEPVEQALLSAAKKWEAYLAKKKISEALRAPLPFSLRFESAGSCADAHQLEIDVSHDPEAKVLSGSELLSQDLEAGRGKGRVWISASVLRMGGALETQLLHQLGHILGNDHVAGTVMAEAVAEKSEARLEIDGARELYICRACDTVFERGEARYWERNGNASVVRKDNYKLQFTSDLAFANHGDSKLFVTSVAGFQGHLASQSFARLGLLWLGPISTPVIVRRNFDKLVEIHLLNHGRPELFLEVTGE